MFKNKKAIIFDWSGTISDDRIPIYKACMKIFSHFGLKSMTMEEWLSSPQMNLIEHLTEFGVEVNVPFIKDLFNNSYLDECKNGSCPLVYDGAKETLEFLNEKGFRLGIVSAHPTERILEEIERYGLNNIFEEVIGWSGEKSDELINMCDLLAVTNKEAVYVGDMIFDIRSAKNVGMASVAKTDGYHSLERLEKENPDLIINSILELKKI